MQKYSLGLVVVEVATDVILPEMGGSWRALRNGDFSELRLSAVPYEFSSLVMSMLDPLPSNRPSTETIVTTPFVSSASSPGSRN